MLLRLYPKSRTRGASFGVNLIKLFEFESAVLLRFLYRLYPALNRGELTLHKQRSFFGAKWRRSVATGLSL
jgi:hypothetical protein